jgi:hypothetical protein
MKKVLSSLTVLFAAALLIYSCNPVDEDQLPPPNNQTQITESEANSLIQGVWYMKRVEENIYYCVGEPVMVHGIFNTSTNFSNYKFEFNNGNLIAQSNAFSMPYEILPDTYDTGLSQDLNMVPGDLCIDMDYSLYNTRAAQLYYSNSFMKIVELTPNKLTLENPSGRVYFERDMSIFQPVNLSGLLGTFIYDGYYNIMNGVIVGGGPFSGCVKATFTSDIMPSSQQDWYPGDFGQYYKGFFDFTDCSSPNYGFLFGEPGIHGPSVGEPYNGDILYFRFQTSESHLFSDSVSKRYKIHILNQSELVIRDYFSCNDYNEYHFTKIN